MSKRLQISIEGERGKISFETFAVVVHNTFDILADLDSAVSSTPQGSLQWFITDVSFGSLLIAIESKSKLPDIDYSSKVTETFVDGLAHIQRERTTPPYFSDYGLRKAQELAKKLRKDGAKAVIIHDIEREVKAMISPEVVPDLGKLINVRFQEIGSVEGRLEMISIHRVPRFTVYHAITQRSIRCKFEPNLLDLVKEALGRRVVVSGVVYFNYRYEAVRVDLQKLMILPKEEELPSPKDLRGMAPDFTGDKTTEEYILSLRE
jgi:hypothetical protein